MAESVILIIFAMLLSLATFLNRKDQAIEQMQGQIADTAADQQRCATALAEAREQLRQLIAKATTDQQHYAKLLAETGVLKAKMVAIQTLTQGTNNFDEMFKELVLMQHQAQRAIELENQVMALTEQQQVLEKVVQRVENTVIGGQSLVEKVDHLIEQAAVWDLLAKFFAPINNPEALHQMEQRLAGLTKLETAVSAVAPGVEAVEAVRTITDQLQASRTQMMNLQGQMANLRRRLEDAGKGTEKPACWAMPDGTPEYIFEVTLRSNGLLVKDNALPNRSDEQKQLPISSINFDREVSLNQFRNAVQPLSKWSQQHECIFFVKIKDQTGSSQKAIYKRKLRTVGEFFYYYEPP